MTFNTSLIIQPGEGNFLGERINQALSEDFSSASMAVAFAKRSGIQHLSARISEFLSRGGLIHICVGIDHKTTSYEALESLLELVGDAGSIYIVHDENPFITFHPKIYLFEAEGSARLIIGSGNLTEGGLYSNDEAMIEINLDLENPDHEAVIQSIRNSFVSWSDISRDTVRVLDGDLLNELSSRGYVLSEIAQAAIPGDQLPYDAREDDQEPIERSFGRERRRFRPSTPPGRVPAVIQPTQPPTVGPFYPSTFVMTLMRTDVGVGQTTPGTSRRSPEIFVPLGARDMFPDFWGWDHLFVEDVQRPGKFDRQDVLMRLGGDTISVNMMTWPVKHDFRLRSEALRSAGEVGDIIRIERVRAGQSFTYYVEIIPRQSSQYLSVYQRCTEETRNSDRVWGYY